MESIATPSHWIGFSLFVLAMLGVDLGFFHRKAHDVRPKEALVWTFVWMALAAVFGAGIFHSFGKEPALEFFTAYLIEKALSVDNVFVFVILFASFKVPARLQHRVLFWGVFGALVMRAFFIGVGAAVLHRFHWAIYPLGAFLVFTGFRMLTNGSEPDPQKNPVFRAFSRWIPSVKEFRGQSFTIVEHGRRLATPLLLVLAAIELTDIVFAVDSIPAIFAVTDDPFVIYTSNIFALMGLRSLYFVLAGAIAKFHYLKVGLSLVLAFVGSKMLVSGVYKMNIVLSLVVIALLLAGSIIASLLNPKKEGSLSQEAGAGRMA